MMQEEEYLEKISEKLKEAANYIDEYLSQKKLRYVLEKLWNDGKRTLDIYYPEEISPGEEIWYADIYQDEINERTFQNWTWTITNKKLYEQDIQSGEREKDSEIPEWEIIVDGPFSDQLVVNTIHNWLKERGYGFEIRMIPKEEAIKSGAFFKNIEGMLKEVQTMEKNNVKV